jgi:hypothetical protein
MQAKFLGQWAEFVSLLRDGAACGELVHKSLNFQFLPFFCLPAFPGRMVIWRSVGPQVVIFPIPRSWSAGLPISEISKSEAGQAIAGGVGCTRVHPFL